jgi:ferredoxin like protein
MSEDRKAERARRAETHVAEHQRAEARSDHHSGSGAESWAPLSFEDRMSTVEFRVHERAHITIDNDNCRGCSTRECTVACPANLFVPTSDGGILFNYESCFECGTCYMVCNRGSVRWSYPEGGHGVVFRRT